MVESTQNSAVYPLTFKGVIIGTISISEDGQLTPEITSTETQAYFQKMFAQGVEGVTVSFDCPIGQIDHVLERGHLRLLRSNNRGHQEAEARSSQN